MEVVAAAAVVVDHGISVALWVANFADHCDNDAGTSGGFGDDDNCFGSDSSADC